MKKKVIAFLLKYKFTETEFINLNMPNLYKNFNTKFIDISEISLQRKIRILDLKIKKKKIFYYKVKKISDLKKILLGVDYVLDYNGSIPENKKINNFFNKENFYNCKFIGIMGGSQPNFFNFNIIKKLFFIYFFLSNIFKYKKFSFAIDILKNFFMIYSQRLVNKKKGYTFFYDYVLVLDDACEKNVNVNVNFISSRKIYVHHKDYEKHLLRHDGKVYNKNFAVFLDESFFDHPDVYELNLSNLSNSKKNKNIYYENLRNFFDNFERVTNTKIIIALHPRSLQSNEDCSNNFNRRIVRNNSYDLVKKSKLAFAHASTSISSAVIFKKPIIFLNSSLMFDIGYFTKILSFSIETGGKIIDINRNNINYKNLFVQDFSLYKNYLNKFVKSSKSRNENLWNIVG